MTSWEDLNGGQSCKRSCSPHCWDGAGRAGKGQGLFSPVWQGDDAQFGRGGELLPRPRALRGCWCPSASVALGSWEPGLNSGEQLSASVSGSDLRLRTCSRTPPNWGRAVEGARSTCVCIVCDCPRAVPGARRQTRSPRDHGIHRCLAACRGPGRAETDGVGQGRWFACRLIDGASPAGGTGIGRLPPHRRRPFSPCTSPTAAGAGVWAARPGSFRLWERAPGA